MRAALYARVSTEEQTEGYSLDAQLDAMREYCHTKGYDVAGEYVDGGYSGRSDNRPQFKRLIADAQDGLFNMVIVHKFDRFARSRDHSVTYKALLRKIGIPVISVMEPTDPDSPASIITEGMFEVLGEWYSANLAQEVRKGKVKSAQLGRWQGGWIKYGYRVNEAGFYEVDDTEAQHLLTMFQKAETGMPLRQLMQWLHKQGIPTKRGGRWTAQHLSSLLRDTTYIGKGLYSKRTRKGSRLVKGEPVSVPFPPIIPEDLFNRVQARLNENKRKNGGGAKQFYLLQHLGKCGECGGSLLCQTIRGHKYLYCSRQLTYPHIHQCYEPKRWHLGMIEDYVWAEVEDTLHDYRNNTYDLLLDRFENAKGEREQQIAKAKEQLDGLKLEKQRLLTTIRKGYVTEVEAEVQFIAINSEREHWEQELSSLQALQTNSEAALDSFIAQLKDLDRMFDYGFNPSPEQKKQLLGVLLKEFVLYRDGRIEIRFKLPVNEKQVADTVLTLSHNNLSLYDRVITPYFPLIFKLPDREVAHA